MSSLDSIKPPRWMIARPVRKLLSALSANGQTARFVGGCVRDAILQKPVKDIDIATPDAPEKVMALLKRARIKAIPTGLKHGTVTAIIQKRAYEITTLRRDAETDGRHARVEFTNDWEEDAKRRDFTMNAIYCDLSGLLFDPVKGVQDALAGRVRFIGSAQDRIAEDYLRILRYFRFYAHYGKIDLDAQELAACSQNAAKIATLSGERIRDEFLKLLSSDRAVLVLQIMREHKILSHIIEVQNLQILLNLIGLETKCDPLRRLAALMLDNNLQPQHLAERFKLSNAQQDRLRNIADAFNQYNAPANDDEAERQIYYLDVDGCRDFWLLGTAQGKIDPAKLPQLLSALTEWRSQKFPLSGDDVMVLGIKQGPQIGDLLRRTEQWWVGEKFLPDYQSCLNHLKQLAGLA